MSNTTSQQIHDWIHNSLVIQGITITGEIKTIHERPWSRILQIPIQNANLFFKSTACFTAHEIALTDYLSKLNADMMPRLLAVDTERAWMIMEDGGQRLREILVEQPEWQHWQNLLPHYGSLQITASKHSDKLLALGLPNRSLAKLPQLYQELVSDETRYQLDMKDGLSTEEYQRLLECIPVVEQKATLLASYNIADSIHHGDLHDANIFYNEPYYSFYDWGDASYSHPFFSLRTAYVSVETRFDIEENSPELNRLRDAYLPAWQDYESEANLQIIFGLAQELWAISSSISWDTMIQTLDSDSRKAYDHVLPSLAQEFLSLIKP